MEWLVVLALMYGLAMGGLYVSQRRLLFVGAGGPKIQILGQGFRELTATASDGVPTRGWWAPAKEGRPTIVFFHGNGDTAEVASFVAAPYLAEGYGFLAVEYRGYGGLEGEPSEAGVYRDARAEIDALIGRGAPARELVLLGHSLGTGVAVEMAREYPVRGVLLLAPYRSIVRVAASRFWFAPVDALMKDRFDSEAKIGEVTAPLFIGVGGKDVVIPPAEGALLFEKANAPKIFFRDPDGGHSDMFRGPFLARSLQWLASL